MDVDLAVACIRKQQRWKFALMRRISLVDVEVQLLQLVASIKRPYADVLECWWEVNTLEV